MAAKIVFVTVPDCRESRRLAQTLVQERLAACVNIIPGVESHYRWKGKIERTGEYLLMIKTTARLYPGLQKRIKALHSYTVPEILAIPVERGHPDYLKWLEESVK